ERTLGVYVEDLFHVTPRLLLSAGVRLDAWRNFDASEATRPVARPDLSAVTNFADRSETALSPRASLLYKLGGSSSLYASAYRAFRAPTLNELYRDFRVGNVLTLANEALRAERLTGGEAGLNVNTLGGRLDARAAFFWLELARPVANVTLAASPALITRQRQNLGRTRSRGVEAEAEARLSRRWSASAGYQFTGARVVRFPASVELEGRRVPQVPRQQLTFGVNYDDPARLSFGVQGRASGPQFDDDLNLFRLGRLFTLDALASRRVTESLSAFVAVENLTGRRYEVGRTPVVTLGPPLSARFGLRVRLGSR
ncbi:MAG TPA: TonB-dependent receptor, partial [Pyrinomonadaceae bacterium]|nr:TonB-dependent receptor [Pyrinomonadaceae bacterium]